MDNIIMIVWFLLFVVLILHYIIMIIRNEFICSYRFRRLSTARDDLLFDKENFDYKKYMIMSYDEMLYDFRKWTYDDFYFEKRKNF